MSRPAVKNLSNRELLVAVKRLVKAERVTTLDVLGHLGEIERRKLYLGLGYGSMFDYCVGHLGYSRLAAGDNRLPTLSDRKEAPHTIDGERGLYGEISGGAVHPVESARRRIVQERLRGGARCIS